MLMGMTDDLPASSWPAGDDARAAERLILQLKCAGTTFIYDLLVVNRSPARIRGGIDHVSSCRRDDVARALPIRIALHQSLLLAKAGLMPGLFD
jgi:hypothetical protein